MKVMGENAKPLRCCVAASILRCGVTGEWPSNAGGGNGGLAIGGGFGSQSFGIRVATPTVFEDESVVLSRGRASLSSTTLRFICGGREPEEREEEEREEEGDLRRLWRLKEGDDRRR